MKLNFWNRSYSMEAATLYSKRMMLCEMTTKKELIDIAGKIKEAVTW